MTSNSADELLPIQVAAIDLEIERRPRGVSFAWHLAGRSVAKSVSWQDLDELGSAARRLVETPGVTSEAILTFGRSLGHAFVGDDASSLLRDGVRVEAEQFTLLRISTAIPEIAQLPWESLVLPGDSFPLLFEKHSRGWLEVIRDYAADESTAEPGQVKCLASWSEQPTGELLVHPEMDELRLRLSRGFPGRFRWVMNASVDELRSRLKLGCGLFLHAGHGRLEANCYYLEFRDRLVDVRELRAEIAAAGALVAIFDCCDSGLGHPKAGAPRLLVDVPSLNCLVGMQGLASDIVSRIHVPALTERLLLGEPVWRAVNLLRVDMYEQGRGDWIRPCIHVKRNYKPFRAAPHRQDYLDAFLSRRARSRPA